MKVREKQADISNGVDSPFITMDRRVWLDYADEVEQLEKVADAALALRQKPINTNPEWVRPLDEALGIS